MTKALGLILLLPSLLIFTGCVLVAEPTPWAPSSFRGDYSGKVDVARAAFTSSASKTERSGTRLDLSEYAALDRQIEELVRMFPISSLDSPTTMVSDEPVRRISSSSAKVRITGITAWKVCDSPEYLSSMVFDFEGGAISISPKSWWAHVSSRYSIDYSDYSPQYEISSSMVVSTSGVSVRSGGYSSSRCSVHYHLRFDEMSQRNAAAFAEWQRSLTDIRAELSQLVNETTVGYPYASKLKRIGERIQFAYETLP